ncbi:CCC motif membrane protein [Formosa sp. PL04]|uniref:CCC motif membrane protein n=1 Tax=Formosa sp. PL04 TaxID=3081755 RepID=UPI0029823594|nr:CCC motif membrane protein [Formosa sp. PL04]MDW5288601.1 CCC motif membrane protein [Formosa sp. PL04]
MERIYLKTTSIYILSGLGLLCCCLGGIGVIFSGIAFYMAYSKLKEVELNPENYENIEGMTTAKTVSMIILIINVIYLIYYIYRLSTTDWNVLIEQSQEIINQSGY